jgi:type I restriction enzyme, S subunit
MSHAWPKVALEEVLQRSEEQLELRPDQTYRQVTVRLWGKGVVERARVFGSEIAAERQTVVRTGQFIISRIDARNGACGLVPPELDGAVVTNDFPVFEVNDSRLLPSYLKWLSRTQGFVDLCKAASEGTTNRVRLKEDRFLAAMMPFPPLPEQQRIVARIEDLVTKKTEADRLRSASDREFDLLCQGFFADPSVRLVPTAMHEMLRLREPDVPVREEETYPFAGVYCFGRGLFASGKKSGDRISYKELTRLKAGNLVYPKLMAWEGAFAVVEPMYDGLVVSTEFPVFEIDSRKVLPEVVDVHFRSAGTWPRLGELSTGTNARRRRLHPERFLTYQFPLLPMEKQILLRELIQRVKRVRELRVPIQEMQDKLIPAILDKAFRGEL